MNRLQTLFVTLLVFLSMTVTAQTTKAETPKLTKEEQVFADLSAQKWKAMADRDVKTLQMLFHDNAMFTHMGGSWGKEQELQIIGQNFIWYKNAEVHSVQVKTAGQTAVVYSDIHLTAEVAQNEVVNHFMVTEVYTFDDKRWQLASLAFTKLLDPEETNNQSNNQEQTKNNTVISTIKKEKVNFYNPVTGEKMAGLLFLPADFDPTRKYAAIVATGPMLSLKEMAQKKYAVRLAENGFVTLTFDFTHFGESEGSPRQLEDPFKHNLDYSAAISFLQNLPYVDAQRIGGIGMCASGSYVAVAGSFDKRMKAVVSIVPALTDLGASLMVPLETVKEHHAKYEANEGPVTYMDMMPSNPPAGIPVFVQGHDYYYTDRNPRPDWDSRAVDWSEEQWIGYSPVEFVKNLEAPYLVVTGDKAFSYEASKMVFDNAASKNKEMLVVKGAGHFELYDMDPYMSEALEKIVPFFRNNLK